jgi:hypothetical protein
VQQVRLEGGPRQVRKMDGGVWVVVRTEEKSRGPML